MVPTVIVFSLVLGLILRPRMLFVAVLLVGVAWATAVVFNAGADFPGGLAVGVANAAVGAILGAGLRTIVGDVRRPTGSP